MAYVALILINVAVIRHGWWHIDVPTALLLVVHIIDRWVTKYR